jgi:hypothetical protein
MPQTEARTRSPKTATVERREASAPIAISAVTRVLRRAMVRVAPRKRDNETMRLSALRPPLGGGGKFTTPGAIAPRERDVLFARAV